MEQEMMMPSPNELMAFYQANKLYVDLIVQNALENNPQMKQMQQQAVFTEQFQEFMNEFPDSGFTGPEDFVKQENAQQFLEYIKMGLSIAQAYKLCNFQKLVENAGRKGKKSGMEQVQSKAHLKSTGGNGAAAGGSVPEDVKDFYHALLEDWSESDIAKHYHRK